MPIALQLSSLRKRFVVGAGSCLASAEVLRGIDLVVRTGEVVGIVGPGGAGKSTLLLCAAGLLTPDAGELRWFGDPSRTGAARRVLYHSTPVDLLRCGRIDEPHVHLIDAGGLAVGDEPARAWIERRRERGDAVVLTTRDDTLARRLATRVLVLGGGRLSSATTSHARVAESVP